MTRVHLRIIAALLALTVLTVTVLGAIYMYQNSIQPEKERKQAVKDLLSNKSGPKADPGKKLYDTAMDLIRRKEMDAAREKLIEIIDVFKDSARYANAREVLGEMNLDRLFARTPMPGKLEYTVGRTRQDNLNAISTKFRTTVSYIKRVNNLLGSVIHPGDRLVLYPLDFEAEVDLEGKRLTLLKDGRYFKDYVIVGHHLTVPNLSRETTVAEIPGWLGGKKIRPDNENYAFADKWLQTKGRGSRSGVVFCPEPPDPPAGVPSAQPGIYLSSEDMHELSTIIRPGIPLRFLKATKS